MQEIPKTVKILFLTHFLNCTATQNEEKNLNFFFHFHSFVLFFSISGEFERFTCQLYMLYTRDDYLVDLFSLSLCFPRNFSINYLCLFHVLHLIDFKKVHLWCIFLSRTNEAI
jgi:hypothetical protein